MQDVMSAQAFSPGSYKAGWDVDVVSDSFTGKTCRAVTARKPIQLLPPEDNGKEQP